jgi:hypothetical protein
VLDEAFFPALWALALETGTRPETLLSVWNYESGLDPAAANPSGCVGLNQSCPKPNGPGFPNDDAAAYRAAPASEQLAWIRPQVLAQIQLNGGKPFASAARAYQANFLPESLAHAQAPYAVICAAVGPYPSAYKQNAQLDVSRDGAITLADLGHVMASHAKDPALVDAIARTWSVRPDGAPWQSAALYPYELGPAVRPGGRGGVAIGLVLATLLGAAHVRARGIL